MIAFVTKGSYIPTARDHSEILGGIMGRGSRLMRETVLRIVFLQACV